MEDNILVRSDWQSSEIRKLFELPFSDLVFKAQQVLRQFHQPNKLQVSQLLSIKTGACPEDCKYCAQSGHYNTGLEKETLVDLAEVVAEAKQAKKNGATRFCMGAAWRSPPEKEIPKLVEMIAEVKSLGMETCMTLGMLDKNQAQQLKAAGLDYYNHNLDTSPEYYQEIVSTRTYEDRLQTLAHVRQVGMKTCCGGILGMGESREDIISLLHQLCTLPEHPESVPINRLIPIAGTPLANIEPTDSFEFVRTIAVARILMPKSIVRLSAGREQMSEELQALCLLAGANSLFAGAKLLTAKNPDLNSDAGLLNKLGISSG